MRMQKKSINRYKSFCRSLENLRDARGRDRDDKFILSGTVQMYNLSFDLSWKVMKDIVQQHHGVADFASGSPRETLRTARSVGLIEDDIWLEMLRVRNNLAHDYDGELAKKYFAVITSSYYDKLDELRRKSAPYYGDEKGA